MRDKAMEYAPTTGHEAAATTEKLVAGPLRGVAERFDYRGFATKALYLPKFEHTWLLEYYTAYLDNVTKVIREVVDAVLTEAEALASLPSSPPPLGIPKIPDAPDTRHAIFHSAEFERGVMSRLEWTDALPATYFALFKRQAPESMKACEISHAIVDFKLPLAEKTELDQAGRGEESCANEHKLAGPVGFADSGTNAADGSVAKIRNANDMTGNPLHHLPDCEWRSLSSESQQKIQKWFEIATEHLQAILDGAALGSGQELREALRLRAEELHRDKNGSGLPLRGYDQCHKHGFETCKSPKCVDARAALALPLAPKVPAEREK